MEEFPKKNSLEQPETSGPDAKETRRRGPRGFLESYLRAFYPERFKNDKKDDEEADIEKPQKKSRWERWTEPFRRPVQRLLKDRVSVEPVGKQAQQNSAPEESKGSIPLPKAAELHTQETTFPKTSGMDSLSEVDATPAEPSEFATKIEHTTEPSTSLGETVEARPIVLPTEQTQVEQLQPSQVNAEGGGAERLQMAPEANTAILHEAPEAELSYNEHARKSEEIRLRREVNRLEQTAKDLKAEQETVRRQQEKFTHNLEKQYKAYEKLHKETLPKLRQSRERLRTRLEPQASTPEFQREVREVSQRVEAPITVKQPSDERLRELANVTPMVQPEAILHTVEHAAEQNIAIESAYERRHELKDDPITARAVTSAAQPGFVSIAQQQASGASIDFAQLTKTTTRVTDQLKAQQPQTPIELPPKHLYAQAVKGGFWAAIMLLLLLAVLSLTR